MDIPKGLESLRDEKIWLCYPLIWNSKKHGGVGGYDKPPVSPYTLYPGYTDRQESLATFDQAAAQIGKTAHVRVKGKESLIESPVRGVGIALGETGICGLDLDNVVTLPDQEPRRRVTSDAVDILKTIGGYIEFSPGGTGLHVLFRGKLPEGKKLAPDMPDIFGGTRGEYQLFDSGYMTVSGATVAAGDLSQDKTAAVIKVYEKYFREVEPVVLSSERPQIAQKAPPVVSSDNPFTFERWQLEMAKLSESEILERIFAHKVYGNKVRSLYEGNISDYGDDHSRADAALCAFLYSFTADRDLTERLFRASGLYRASGKSRSYIKRTLNKAMQKPVRIPGRIELTREEKKAYAQRQEAAEKAARRSRLAERIAADAAALRKGKR